VSDKVCDEILSGRIPLDGESKEVTVLISDLRDYTPLVESTPPKQLVLITNTYLEAMAKTIQNHKGLILQYVGDSIQAVFGAPLPVENHPELAVNAALEMRKQLDRVNEKLESEGFEELRHGIGIHSGKVTAANIGSPDRLSYSLSGLTVNLASRIQNLNKKFGTDILVSATTVAQIGNNLEIENLGPTEIKGLKEPLEIYKII
jgi:adenylate cyclase